MSKLTKIVFAIACLCLIASGIADIAGVFDEPEQVEVSSSN